MKLLCLPSLLVCCLSLAEAADFKHFPVVAGRQDSAKTEIRGAPAPARPPGNRERVRESVRNNKVGILDPSSDYSDGDEDVPQVRVASTTERIRVNRNRSRSRKRIGTSEKKVETTVKPLRQRTRIRTQAPRLETSTRRQTPTVEKTATEAAPVKQFNDFSVDKEVIKQAFNQAQGTFAMDPFLQNEGNPKPAFPTPKLIPNLPSKQASQSFSQSLTGLFHPASSPTVSRFTEERQQQRFIQAQTQPPRASFIQTQTQPPPLRVITENQQFSFQTQPIQKLEQPFKARTTEREPQFTRQSAQPQQQQPLFTPLRSQEVFSSPPAQNTDQHLNQASAPTFQGRPSLFSTPIEFPQQEGAGASFSYSAILG